MRISRIAAGAAATILLAIPAAGLAAKKVTADNGKFTGTAHYKVAGKAQKADVTITVAKRKISAVELIAAIPPLDIKASKGPACGSANDYSTKGFKRSGTTSPSGRFNYTFTDKGKGFSDTVYVVGRFTDAKHATGTWRDKLTSDTAKSHCDTGKLKFSVTHS